MIKEVYMGRIMGVEFKQKVIQKAVDKVYGQKAGYWIEKTVEDATWDRRRFYCSECEDWQTYGKTPYCPYCGKKMENAE